MADSNTTARVTSFLQKTVGQAQLSFDQVWQKFSAAFSALPERVCALNALLGLVRSQRLPLPQKLAALFILLRPDHFGAEPRSMIENPFLPALVDQIKSDIGSGQTARFLCDLILSTGHEPSQKIGCKTPKKEAEEIADGKMLEFSSGKIAEQMQSLKKALEKSQSPTEGTDPVFEFAEKVRNGDPFSENGDFADFPHFSFVFPRIDHPCDKLEWVFPFPEHTLVWESKIEKEPFPSIIKAESIFYQKMSKGERILREDERFLSAFFDGCAASAREDDCVKAAMMLIERYVTKSHLKKTVESSRAVFSTMMYCLSVHGSDAYSRTLDELSELPVSSKTIAAWRATKGKAKLEKASFKKFVMKAMKACETDKKKAVSLAKYLCRLLCEIMSENNEYLLRDLYVELQTFCIAFNNVSEANSLFSLLKGLKPA